MKHSIGGFFLRGVEGGYLQIKSIPDLLRNLVVKPKARDDGGFGAQLTFTINPGPRSGQAYNVLTAPVTACGNAVNDEFSTFCQVNEIRLS